MCARKHAHAYVCVCVCEPVLERKTDRMRLESAQEGVPNAKVGG